MSNAPQTDSAGPVIILHGIATPRRALEVGEEAFWLTQDMFYRALDLIAQMGPVRPLITFDDGNASDIEIALPALADRKLTATFFLLAGRLNTPGSLTSEDVTRLAKAGHSIGLHGHDHVDWRQLDAQGRQREFITARATLAALARTPVTAAAAPFGLYNRQTLLSLRELGFAALYTSDRGLARDDTFIRPRNCLEGAMTNETLKEALTGHVRPLRRLRRLAGIARKRLLPVRMRS